jgi:hypothetical protein
MEEIMQSKPYAFSVVLIVLMLAALACNTVMGGGSAVNDAQATADALQTEAAEQFGDPQATADAALTEAAGVFDDLTTPEGEEPTEESGTDEEEPTEAPLDIPGSGEAPDDVPVFEGNNENFFGSADVVTYLTDGSYDDLVAFYRSEMEANGWTLDETLSTEFGGIAALTYNKDNRTATVSILTDTSSGKTLVAVNIVSQ